MKLKKIFI